MRLISNYAVLVVLVVTGVCCTRGDEGARKPRLLHAAATGEVAALVRARVAASGAAGRQLLVYVGAPWCEPCRHFKRALQKGQLDGALPRLDLLEFDLQRDRARLRAAGYASRMVPLFARPKVDGRASGRRIQGSVKGPGAVGNIVPRLRRLLATR